MAFTFDWLGLASDALRAALDPSRTTPGTRPADVPAPPDAGTPERDALLPPRVGSSIRTYVNDRFGGLDRGGLHAAYDAAGHPVRVMVRRAASSAAADAMVARAPRTAGHAAWSEGRLWFYVSGGTVAGDEDPTFGPGDVEATARFVADFRAQRGGAA